MVTFPSGERHAGRAVSVDDHWDQSLIELQSVPQARGVRVAAVNPQPGQRVAALGYAFGGELKKTIGKVVQYVAPSAADPTDWFAFTGAAAQGCSGGPIFNERGELIGNLWAAQHERDDRGRALRPHAAVFVALASPAGSGAIGSMCRWAMPAGANSSACLSCRLRHHPRHVPPTDPLPPANPPSDPVPAIPPPEVDVEIDYARIADLVIERMKADPEPFRGPAGLAGPQGPPGVPGPEVRLVQQDHQDHREKTAPAVPLSVVLEDKSGQAATTVNVDADGVLRLPPVVLEIETPDGKVQQQAQPLGHPIRIRLVPVTNKT